jgi:PhoH-like ATPase
MNNSEKSKVFVLDTNVILHDSSCIYKFKEHDIMVPIQVIEELDEFKKGLDTIHYHAREFCRFLDERSTDHIFNGGVSLGDGLGKIRIALAQDFDDHIRKNLKNQNVDAEIINIAYTLQKAEEYRNTDIIIVSKDVNLRMKAKALGIIAQDFLSDVIINIDSLSDEVKVLQIESKIINSIYKSNEPIPFNIESAYENQNFILKEDKKSVLVIYKDGMVSKIMKERLKPFNIIPKNAEQSFAVSSLLDSSLSLVSIEGKAGTGKTIVALACGLSQLAEDKYKKIFVTRETVSMGNKEIGFLPGGIEDKIGPFMNGINDNLGIISEISSLNRTKITQFQNDGSFKVEPLPFIRGRSLHNVFFIIDEAQNLTPHQVKTIVTRAGEGTKMVFIGDTHQIDSPYLDRRSNGLSYLIQKFRGQKCYSHIRLFKSERSNLAELAGTLL